MAANIFEIIVRKGFDAYDASVNISVNNGEFNTFVSSPLWGMQLPSGYSFAGLSANSGDDDADAILGVFFNSDFTEAWANPTSIIGGATTYASFHDPEGWTVTMFSVANSGRNAPNTSNTEDNPTCGYFYYQGNAHKLSPALNHISRGSAGTTEERINGIEDFSFIPAATALWSGTGLENTNDVLLPSHNVSFGSLQGLNIYPSPSTRNVTLGSNKVRVTEKMQSSAFLALYGFNDVYGNTVGNAVNGWSDPTAVADKWFFNNISITKSLYFSNPASLMWSAYAGEEYVPLTYIAPPIVRFKDVFNASDLGKYVTVKTSFVSRAGATFFSQALTGCQGTNNYNTDGDQVEASAVDFSVNTSTGVVSGTSDGSFYPNIIHEATEGPIAYSDMTDTVFVDGDRLILIKSDPNISSSMIADVNLRRYSSYRIFFNVAGVTGDIPVTFNVHLFRETNSGWDSHASAINNTTSDDFGIDFETTAPIDGTPVEGLCKYRLQISILGGLNGSVEFGAIRFSMNYTAVNEITDFSDTFGLKLTTNPFVITTSDFTKDPDSQFGNTEIDGNQGVDAFKYYDINDNVGVGFTDNAYTSIGAGGDVVIDTREFCNPYAVGTLGTPMVKENESHQFPLKNVLPKDPQGFYWLAVEEELGEVVSTIKIGSPHLNLYQDTLSGSGIISAEWALENIEFGTCESSFISRADSAGDGSGSGLDKLHLYYDPNPSFPSYQTSNITPPPEAKLNTVIHNDVIMGSIPLTIGYKVDSLVGDPIILDFGAGTNTITIDTAGTGASVVVPNGNQLRVRTQTALEKGSAVAAVEAVIDYVSLSVTLTGTLLLAEKYGDESSNNSSLPDIGEFDASLRVYSIEASTLALTNSVGGVQMFKIINGLEGSSEVIIKINVLSLGTGNSLSVIESFSGVEVTTLITSTGETAITYTNTPEESMGNILEIIFLSDGSNPLDIKITSIAVEKTSLSSSNLSITTIDLYDDFEMPINFSVKDFTNLSSGSGDYTKTLTVPATKNNMGAVDFIGNINSIHNKETTAGFPCMVKAEGLPIFEGALHLTETDLDEHGEVELKFNILGGNALWVDVLRSLNIKDLNSNEYPISSSSIIAIDGLAVAGEATIVYPNGSIEAEAAFADYLNPNLDTEILFPLVDNGRWFVQSSDEPDITSVGWDNVKASYRIKNVLDKIFKSIGYTLSSTFINGETDWSAEFSSEFYSMFSNIIGIAPSMSVRDSDITNSEIDLQTLTLQESAYKHGALGAITTPRPTLSSEMQNMSEGFPAKSYYCDWVYLKFETTNVDRRSDHSLNTISGFLGENGFGNTDSGDPVLKNQSEDVNTTYSTIRVGRSGYYDLNVAVKGNFNVAIDGSFYNTVEDDINSFGNAESKFTVALIADDMALDDLYKNDSSMGALLFDLYDKGWVSLNAKNYDNTRLSLTKVQYLEAHKDYNIVAISAIKDQLPTATLTSGHGTDFELLEVDFNLKLSKDVAPMKGRNNIVYTNVSTPTVTYAEVLPNVTALDFISELSKIFNLVWTTNSTTKVIEVEPYEDFFDLQGEGDSTPYKDWSDKAVIKNVKENGVLDSNLIYKMASDSSDYSINLSQSGLSLGDKQVASNRATNAFVKDKEKEYKLDIFSALTMDWDSHLVRDINETNEKFYPIFLPKIWSKPSSTLYPELNEQKPDPNNEHNHKLAYVGQRARVMDSQPIESYSGVADDPKKIQYMLEGVWHYGTYSSTWGSLSGGRFLNNTYLANTYLQASSYSPVGSDMPNLTFADSLGATSSEGGLYNVYHQPLIEMLMMRDKIITADVNLSAGEINDINFRQLINIDGNLYIINKIKDFNFSGEPTEVELLLVTPRGLKEKIK
jgi:hypothetical protein